MATQHKHIKYILDTFPSELVIYENTYCAKL